MKRLLEGMQFVPEPGGQTLDRAHLACRSAWTASIRHERTGDAVHLDGAGSAHAVLATDVGTGELRLVADEVRQQQSRFDLALIALGR